MHGEETRGQVAFVDARTQVIGLDSGGHGRGTRLRYDGRTTVEYRGRLYRPQDLDRGDLVRISNTYFTGIDTGTTSRGVFFSPDCQRRENGNIMASNPDAEPGSMASLDCRTQFDTGFQVIVTDIRERRFEVVDRTRGLTFGWGYFDHDGTPEKMSRTLDRTPVDVAPTFRQPSSFYIAEVFKVMDGQIRQIEAVLTTVPYQMESGW